MIQKHPQKVCVVGQGGREAALVFALRASHCNVIAVPGNDGMKPFTECISAPSQTDEASLTELASCIENSQPDLVVIGPDALICAGLADILRARSLSVVGPSKSLAQLEGSKDFAKKMMALWGVRTAESWTRHGRADIRAFIQAWDFSQPLVVKADGLAGGKGVVIAMQAQEALSHCEDMAMTATVVFEKFIKGHELSVTVLISDRSYCVLPPVQDHKRRFEKNQGPNTGGMGTVAPPRGWTHALEARIEKEVVQKSCEGVWQLSTHENPYRGVLFIGVMVADDGTPYVLEYNCRFGDPEMQALYLLSRGHWDKTWLEMLLELSKGQDVSRFQKIATAHGAAVNLVLVSKEYPQSTGRSPHPMTGLDENGQLIENNGDITIFHGSTLKKDGQWLAREGRVLGVGAVGPDLDKALNASYRSALKIHFEGISYRKDLGK